MTDKDNETTIFQRENIPPVILATKKKESLYPFYQALGFPPVLNRRDPEQPHWSMKRQTESAHTNPVQVALEKTKRIKEALPFEKSLPKESSIIASDVAFFLNGEQLHQIIRGPEDEERFYHEPWELWREELILMDKYALPFEAIWHVAFVIEDEKGNLIAVEMKIRCVSPKGLTKEQVHKNFRPKANAGVRLTELMREEDAIFEVMYEGELEETSMERPRISGEQAQQYIVDKILDAQIFWNFILKKQVDRQNIGLFSVALTHYPS